MTGRTGSISSLAILGHTSTRTSSLILSRINSSSNCTAIRRLAILGHTIGGTIVIGRILGRSCTGSHSLHAILDSTIVNCIGRSSTIIHSTLPIIIGRTRVIGHCDGRFSSGKADIVNEHGEVNLIVIAHTRTPTRTRSCTIIGRTGINLCLAIIGRTRTCANIGGNFHTQYPLLGFAITNTKRRMTSRTGMDATVRPMATLPILDSHPRGRDRGRSYW
mmetsp:Transcript_31906/g.70120  ORF Transcript_31906/g.70120 Transcript_31906/m.70120 type:complete len:219 (-) Transcript_31906:166-822(-)